MSEELSGMETPQENIDVENEKRKALGEEILSIINSANAEKIRISVLALKAAVKALREGTPSEEIGIGDMKESEE